MGPSALGETIDASARELADQGATLIAGLTKRVARKGAARIRGRYFQLPGGSLRGPAGQPGNPGCTSLADRYKMRNAQAALSASAYFARGGAGRH